MKPDLQGLELTQGELRRLIGFAPRHLAAPFWARVGWLSVWYSSLNYGAIALLRLGLFYLSPLTLTGEAHFWISLLMGIGTAIYHRWHWQTHTVTLPLRHLLADAKQFNLVVKAIHINDQLEEAGNSSVAIKDREQVLEALWLTREDLVRALKTERILRENKEFITRNACLFDNNISALAALQVSDQASEHGRLLNEALQIAMNTQEEMRRLQS
ncbi:MAG: hypothetical protein NW220_18820 [Leptolyngbyaceae cyanobacterium bins.349]|nr:hypothetical protein [Leptolyngbyaceae cyanobacterium bins.349]